MRWTDSLFLKVIVGVLGCGLEGWPRDIPFQNPSYFGKSTPLEKLVKLWKEGTLRIVKLSEEERARATQDPESFLPNTALRPALTPSPKPADEAVRVIPLVFHPADFHELSQPSSSADTSSHTPLILTTTALPVKRKRKQRCDTKLARTRALYYGRGVKSQEYVYDAEDEDDLGPDPKRFREALSDNYIEEFPEAEVEAVVEDEIEEFPETAAAEDGEETVSDIEQFTDVEDEEEDEIESASEDWLLGEDSDEVEDIE